MANNWQSENVVIFQIIAQEKNSGRNVLYIRCYATGFW